ncbi:MAG: RNA pyrophosphohydrolase [Phenylobacterium sp.]|uniref:RNA pyrophosphohydrolase n=1 Tax=Phenylobacterium sp. TaxID=1871053 RepID=UPI003BB5BD5C
MDDLTAYRPNVGVVLFHPDGRVWLGRRVNTPEPYNWQFPQGGVDAGEDLYAAARRELAEETGAVSTTLLGRTDGWMAYDFPPGHNGSKIAKGWKGQRQVWFALRFDGEDAEINLSGHGHPEFDAWRWGKLSEAPALVVPFKKANYEAVVTAFHDFAGLPGRAA